MRSIQSNTIRSKRSLQIAAGRKHTSRSTRVNIMAFLTKQDAMLQAARKYVHCWAKPSHDLKDHLLQVCSPNGVLYRADGVVHPHDRHKSVDDLAAHIQERHAAYKHIVHDPFCMAADEDSHNVYLGVRYILMPTAHVACTEPTGRPSEGVLLEKLELDDDNKITAALVCRSLTIEERNALTVDPSAVHPGPLQDDALYAGKEELGPQDMDKMKSNVDAWVNCWDTHSSEVDRIEQILAPDVRQISGYGLGKHRIPFKGQDGSRDAVKAALSHLDNTNKVLGKAVCPDMRAGFVHWESIALPSGGHSPEHTAGLDYLRFDTQGRINFIYNFTMRPYMNVRDNEPARQDRVD